MSGFYEIPRIDWNPEFKKLEPLLNGKGGNVCIRYHGEDCAWNRFDAALKSQFHRAKDAALSLRIEPEWHSTRYLETILDECERLLRDVGVGIDYAAPLAGNSGTGGETKVLSDLSGNGLSIHTGDIHADGNPPLLAQHRSSRVARICSEFRTLLKSKKRIMVVLHCASESKDSDVGHFWKYFWQSGLRDLIDDGLLFIFYWNTKNLTGRYHRYPDNCITIDLPRDLLDEDREASAYDDLIDILVGMGLEPQYSAGLSRGHTNATKGSMANFYNSLLQLILTEQQKQGQA